MKVARFYIENFGCRATQADGAALERQFLERGLERAGGISDAEIVVLNTCTVTAGADKDVRASVRRLQRLNPGCRILVTGCYAQRAPEEIASLPGVSWVVGNSHKHQAAQIATASLAASGFVSLAQLAGEDSAPEIVVGDIFAHTELMAAPVFEAANERTRPNLKVQDGCDNRCSFCVIPYVRGQSRSLPLERVLREVRTLVEGGNREVVISGINLGRWGRDLAVGRPPTVDGIPGRPTTSDRRLVGLIHAILDQTSLEKLRISSVEPMDWSDALIELVASSPRIAKHAHVPMQSGSDAVLRRMHRKYRPWHYREKIQRIREAMPFAAIGADVMVGFPGETEAEFDETRRMVEELPFTYLHVFTYSARPGTPAAQAKKQVPPAVARERNSILREIASVKKSAFLKSLVGRETEAITLQSGGDSFTEALTDNYLKARLAGKVEANRWVRFRADGVEGDSLIGNSASGQEIDEICSASGNLRVLLS
ncbi:MAG TPA: tRNA (N(6)-L-threonylcarbamoyladenosine(37)-C(2))-methylthiotransferase MtaB [Terriglobales bacterium]|nr:tRNA (N(6)-L-threonylcarbamoyladenosine(37)-C(2))-methylthiotransferase MtaB [Terriglobales bacterium]